MVMVWPFFAAVFLAEVAGTVAGFGSSTLLLPVAVLFFDFQTALVLVAFVHIFGNLGRITLFRKELDLPLLLYFGMPGVVLTALGALLVASLDQETLKGLLGIFLIFYTVYAIGNAKFRIAKTGMVMFFGGAASGFLAGLIGTGGALRAAFLTAFGMSKARYIVTGAAIALMVDATRLPLYVGQGFLRPEYYWFLPVLFALAIAGSLAGKRLVDKLPQILFRKIVLGFVGIVGIVFAVQWLA